MPFPNLNPEIFSFEIFGFNFALRWYALSYIFGFVIALFIMKTLIKKPKLWKNNTAPLEADDADNIITYLILGVILGGRLGYVFFYNLEFYVQHPFDVLRIWDGGMSFHGGFLGVILGVYLYCRNKGLLLWSAADLIAVSSPPGIFFGRLANFINGELWGKPTDLPFGVVFPGAHAQICEDASALCARHPSQLYEAFSEGLLLFALLIYIIRLGALRRPGLVTGTFFVVYGISRFLVEYVRVPDPQFFSDTNPFGFAYQLGQFGVTMGQLLSFPMILVGLLLLVSRFNRGQG